MKGYWMVTAALSLAWPVTSAGYVGQAGDEQKSISQPQLTASISSATEQKPLPVTASPNLKAQTAPQPGPAAQNNSSYLLVELSKTLNAKKLKPGDKIKAEVSQDVLSHGKIIIPAETQVIGHVTEVSVRDHGNPESRLGIVFDRIHLKHYHDINIQAVVQRVEPPVQRRSLVDQPSQMLPPALMMGGIRPSGPTAGRPGSTTGRMNPPQTIANSTTDTTTVPFTVRQSPTTNAQTGGSAAQLKPRASGGQAMSVGMPYGVTGIKGLSLSPNSSETPGPVIVSNKDNVKLEYGTQILLHVLTVETPQQPAK